MSNTSKSRAPYDFETDVFPAELAEIARRRIEIARRCSPLELEKTLKQEGITDTAEIERRRKLLEDELESLSDPFDGCERKPCCLYAKVGGICSGYPTTKTDRPAVRPRAAHFLKYHSVSNLDC